MIHTLPAADASSLFSTGEEHVVIFLGILVSLFAIIAGVRAWRKERELMISARDAAIISASKHKELLEEIAKEFKPNHGSSLVDRVSEISKKVDDHNTSASQWFKENDEAHTEIKNLHAEHYTEVNRRVDGLYEIILGGSANSPRKLAAKHQINREESQ